MGLSLESADDEQDAAPYCCQWILDYIHVSGDEENPCPYQNKAGYETSQVITVQGYPGWNCLGVPGRLPVGCLRVASHTIISTGVVIELANGRHKIFIRDIATDRVAPCDGKPCLNGSNAPLKPFDALFDRQDPACHICDDWIISTI
jgi:hypothetical protein